MLTMSSFPAVILLQVIYVHRATAELYPYFVGHMANQVYENQNASTIFECQHAFGFSATSGRPTVYSEFRIPSEGIYWISLRPMDVASGYHVRVDDVIVATAESPRWRKSAVGFARFLRAGSVVRVTRNTYSRIVTVEQLTYVDSIFSITFMLPTNEGNASVLFWTAKYIATEINNGVNTYGRATFSYDTGLAIDNTTRSRMFSWYFIAPFDAVYWVSIRAVPDNTMTRGFMILEKGVEGYPERMFTTWVKDGLGSYMSQPIFLKKDMWVTVRGTYTEGRRGFTEDTMVSVVLLPPENHWIVAGFPTPVVPPDDSDFFRYGRDVDMPPPYAKPQNASNSKLRRSLHPRLSGIGRQRRSVERLCRRIVSFDLILQDPQGLFEGVNRTTIILKKSGLYIISLRNDPMSIPHGTTSIMQVYHESLGMQKKLLRVTCFPPSDTSLPEGADAAYYLERGDKLWVEQPDTRGIDYATRWSVALLKSG